MLRASGVHDPAETLPAPRPGRPPRPAPRPARPGPTGWPGECSIRMSSMLTPAAPTSTTSRASSPGRSARTTGTTAYAVERPPCLPGSRARPALPRTSTSRSEVRAHSASSATSCSAPTTASTSWRSSVRMRATGSALATRMSTHRSGSEAATRVTSRRPCPVSASAASAPSASRAATSEAATCGTCETRATAASWSAAPISTGDGPAQRQQGADPGQRALLGAGRRHRPGPPLEEVGAGGARPGPLATGHRVGAHEVRRRAHGGRDRAQHAVLHRRRVDHGGGDVARQQAADHLGGRRRADRDHGQVDLLGRRVEGAGPELRRLPGGRRVAVREVHDDAVPAQGEGHRRTDQTGPDDQAGPDQRGVVVPRVTGRSLGEVPAQRGRTAQVDVAHLGLAELRSRRAPSPG